MKATVTINRRSEIADPEGTTVRRALHELGYEGVSEVRMNRVIHLVVDGDNAATVKGDVEEMCRRLLANPVLEDFEVVIEG